MLLSRIQAPMRMLAVANLAVLPRVTLLVQVDEHVRLARIAVSTMTGEFDALTHLFGIRSWQVDF